MAKQGAYWRLYQAQLRQADDDASEGAVNERAGAQMQLVPSHAAHPAGDA
jgi:ATP-binding cassette subfamily B protein